MKAKPLSARKRGVQKVAPITKCEKFEDAGKRRWAVLRSILSAHECISCVESIGMKLRSYAYAITDVQVAMDIGWLERAGYVEVKDAACREGHIILLTTKGFDFFRGPPRPAEEKHAA